MTFSFKIVLGEAEARTDVNAAASLPTEGEDVSTTPRGRTNDDEDPLSKLMVEFAGVVAMVIPLKVLMPPPPSPPLPLLLLLLLLLLMLSRRLSGGLFPPGTAMSACRAGQPLGAYAVLTAIQAIKTRKRR
jgi:hypothetical protein